CRWSFWPLHPVLAPGQQTHLPQSNFIQFTCVTSHLCISLRIWMKSSQQVEMICAFA
ncbi:hypothetical protein AMECASPLE_019059, partial [Ameca splendens]